MKKYVLVILAMVVLLVMGATNTLTTTISPYEVFYQNTDVAGTPDTTLLTAPTTAFVVDAISGSSNFIDLLHPNTNFKGSRANSVQFIFSHGNGTGDADATTSVFELWGQNAGGPRQLICTIALVGGKAELVAGTDDNTWVDTATVTSYHTKTIAVADNAADRVVSVTLDVVGFRYLQGLFTGSGSTSVITTAYYRYF